MKEIHLTSDDLKQANNLVMLQQAEVASLDVNCFRQFFKDKGYQWLLEMAEKEVYNTDIDTRDLDPEMIGLDAGTGGWLLDILSWLHTEAGTHPGKPTDEYTRKSGDN